MRTVQELKDAIATGQAECQALMDVAKEEERDNTPEEMAKINAFYGEGDADGELASLETELQTAQKIEAKTKQYALATLGPKLDDNEPDTVKVPAVARRHGGYVYDGMMIYNALAQHEGKITVTVEGLAHSAASLIAMAGDTIRMHEASDLGIHRAWAGAIGNSKTMRSLADWLDKIDSHLVSVYSARSGQPEDRVSEWLDGVDDGTIFTAVEAVAAGFADEVIEIQPKDPPAKDLARQHEMLQARLKAKHASYRHR